MKRHLILIAILSYFAGFAQTENENEMSRSYDIKEVIIESKRKFKKGDRIAMNNLNFKGGTTELLPESIPLLEDLLKIMQDNPQLKIQIQGHICCISDARNEISEGRAKLIWVYLLLNEVENERVTYRDYGASRPIYFIPERNEMERKANRRVEIEILSN